MGAISNVNLGNEMGRQDVGHCQFSFGGGLFGAIQEISKCLFIFFLKNHFTKKYIKNVRKNTNRTKTNTGGQVENTKAMDK